MVHLNFLFLGFAGHLEHMHVPNRSGRSLLPVHLIALLLCGSPVTHGVDFLTVSFNLFSLWLHSASLKSISISFGLI